jgi:hypothetical protein
MFFFGLLGLCLVKKKTGTVRCAVRTPRQRRKGLVKWFTNTLYSARWTRAGTPQRAVPAGINSFFIPQFFVKGIIQLI